MSLRLTNGCQVDLRVVAAESFGAALQYFTGSQAHNIVLRGLAKDRKMKINEYGVFRGEKRIAGRTEEEVYAALDLPCFPPEIREARFEFQWAEKGPLPELVDARRHPRRPAHAQHLVRRPGHARGDGRRPPSAAG